MLICPIDFETNGKDPKECRPTEMGAAIIEPYFEFNQEWTIETLANMNNVIYSPEYPPQDEELVREVTPHLTDEVLKSEGIPFVHALINLLAMFDGQTEWPSYFIAHNADFDEQVFRAEMRRNEAALKEVITDEILQKLWSIKWLCSLQDIQWPERKRCRQLSHLALDYGVKMDGRNLHQAISDVLLLIDLLTAVKVDWNELIKYSEIPTVIVRAVIPPPFGKGNDGGVGKNKCKELKFRYEEIDDVKLKQTWLKKLKMDKIQAEQELLGYPLHIVN